jgi:hypothetical protein
MNWLSDSVQLIDLKHGAVCFRAWRLARRLSKTRPPGLWLVLLIFTVGQLITAPRCKSMDFTPSASSLGMTDSGLAMPLTTGNDPLWALSTQGEELITTPPCENALGHKDLLTEATVSNNNNNNNNNNNGQRDAGLHEDLATLNDPLQSAASLDTASMHSFLNHLFGDHGDLTGSIPEKSSFITDPGSLPLSNEAAAAFDTLNIPDILTATPSPTSSPSSISSSTIGLFDQLMVNDLPGSPGDSLQSELTDMPFTPPSDASGSFGVRADSPPFSRVPSLSALRGNAGKAYRLSSSGLNPDTGRPYTASDRRLQQSVGAARLAHTQLLDDQLTRELVKNAEAVHQLTRCLTTPGEQQTRHALMTQYVVGTINNTTLERINSPSASVVSAVGLDSSNPLRSQHFIMIEVAEPGYAKKG